MVSQAPGSSAITQGQLTSPCAVVDLGAITDSRVSERNNQVKLLFKLQRKLGYRADDKQARVLDPPFNSNRGLRGAYSGARRPAPRSRTRGR